MKCNTRAFHVAVSCIWMIKGSNDGMWNRVDHPLNHPPTKLIDNIALRDPSPDRPIEEETAFWLYDQDGNLVTDQDGDPFG